MLKKRSTWFSPATTIPYSETPFISDCPHQANLSLFAAAPTLQVEKVPSSDKVTMPLDSFLQQLQEINGASSVTLVKDNAAISQSRRRKHSLIKKSNSRPTFRSTKNALVDSSPPSCPSRVASQESLQLASSKKPKPQEAGTRTSLIRNDILRKHLFSDVSGPKFPRRSESQDDLCPYPSGPSVMMMMRGSETHANSSFVRRESQDDLTMKANKRFDFLENPRKKELSAFLEEVTHVLSSDEKIVLDPISPRSSRWAAAKPSL